MGRSADPQRVNAIADYVERHPGSRPADIARDLQVDRSTVNRTLPAVEEAGRLLVEDNHGRLWPFHK
jgi:DNA-binding MarR family transcriptional regulator